jgi:predicted nucleic acid-binding protein
LVVGKITEERAREIMQIQASLALTIHGDIPIPAENMAPALRYQLSSYDAAYLDLALRLRVPVATADGALYDAAVATGVGVFSP